MTILTRPPARYALARLSESHATHPLSKLLATLLNVTTNRNHSKVYATATTLVELISQPGFFDQDLAMVLTKLTTVFMERFRLRTFELLSRAYNSLTMAQAENYLGVPSETILAEASKNGWEYDSTSQILKPRAFSQKSNNTTNFSSLSTFAFVADSVGRLEA
ncbi:hypothetical protein D9611_004818 [Ephemerocybe angulata]|uniref:CSN8/PSMD8/EIF3K domain-containing protein n=1 Tax=Ephemerocybe angulata TaxID=980116 RepID=A0A8H5B2S9_9AGAR|nr:hypothetical protein D9611_004818 [Tulosesus angulatus]